MTKRNATVAVIGAGDFIGAAIAKKFAAEGFPSSPGGATPTSSRRLLRRSKRPAARSSRAASMPARKTISGVSARRRRSRAARGLHLQCRRQCQFSAAGNDRARVSQGLGTGLLCRLSDRPRGGARDAAARQRLHLFHRRDREPARRHRLCGVRQRQVRPARGGAKHGARARAEEHPCRASDHRRRRRHRVRARAHQAARRRGGAGKISTRIS